jgi:hypothetical protein
MKETTVKAILCGMNLETWLLLSTIAVALVIILLVKKRAGEKFTRHEGAIMIVTAPILFVLSGLFLANTVINPVESFPYLVGEVLCFAVAPTLLILGVIICATAPHKKSEKRVPAQLLPVAPLREKPLAARSASRLLLRRIIGLAFILILLISPFIAEGVKGINLFIALFVAFPFPLITVPYMGIALYLSSKMKPRWIDVPAIIVCATLLLSLLVPGMAIMMVFFLPYIMVGTPFGLISILILIIVLAVILMRRKNRRSPYKLSFGLFGF